MGLNRDISSFTVRYSGITDSLGFSHRLIDRDFLFDQRFNSERNPSLHPAARSLLQYAEKKLTSRSWVNTQQKGSP